MGKRPKNWGVTPLERLKQSQDAKAGKLPEKKPKKIKIDKFAKGIITEIGDFKYAEPNTWYHGGWRIEGNKIVYDGGSSQITWDDFDKKEEPKKSWEDEWYEQNKDSF